MTNLTTSSTQTALITGASSGIGWELAHLFAKDGINLVLVARSEKSLRKLALMLTEKYKVKCDVLAMDLARPLSCKEIYNITAESKINIDFLVNNAGFGNHGPFCDTDLHDELEMVQVNCNALIELTKYFLPAMMNRKAGRILNVASTASFQPGPYMAVYYASKAFVLSLSEALSFELRNTGVTVTALCPGPTASGFQLRAAIGHIPLVKGRDLPTSATVAATGYRAMMRGKPIIITGWLNRFLVFSLRFSPRSMVRMAVGKIQMARQSVK